MSKLASIYLLTPVGVEENARITIQCLSLKMQEHEMLQAQIEEFHSEAALIKQVLA